MAAPADLDALRRSLGPVGAFVGVRADPPGTPSAAAAVLDVARRVEAAGYRALWSNEVVGADALVRSALWLAASDALVVGTCIANMWVRPAPTARAAAAQLTVAHPGRFVLGLGVGYPPQAASVGRDFGSPLATAREYLQEVGELPCPVLLAAGGPRMLALAAELADGALPAGRPPEQTARARSALRQGALLVVHLSVGALGGADAVTRAAREHLDAGADHVVVGMPYDTDLGASLDRLEALGPALAALRG